MRRRLFIGSIRSQAGMLGVVLIGAVIMVATIMLVRQSLTSGAYGIEKKYFDRTVNNALLGLLSATDDDLEQHITIYDLIKSAKEDKKVGIKDAKTYTPPVIHKKMRMLSNRFLERYSMHYYLYVGSIDRPILTAGDYEKYNKCKTDPKCRLQVYTDQFEDIYLYIFRTCWTSADGKGQCT
ncbi:MAG: hypothetical protein QGG26_03980 [Candidatus Undinarchaeales archaeon]|nr:hypothetical protein [Candidatus Undinarchaeales archaeon]